MATSIRHLDSYRETLSLPAGPPLDRMQSEDAPAHWAALSHHQSRATFQGVPASFMSRNAVRVHSLITISKRPYSGSIHKRLLSVSPPRREASSQAIVSQRSASRPPRQPSHGNNAMRARSGQALRQMGICVRIFTQISPTPSLTWAYSDTGAHLHATGAHPHAIFALWQPNRRARPHAVFRHCVHICTQCHLDCVYAGQMAFRLAENANVASKAGSQALSCLFYNPPTSRRSMGP